MAIRLYEGRMEFDYDSSDGTVKTTHTVYIESDGLYFDGTIYGTGAPGVTITGQYLAPEAPGSLHPNDVVPNDVPSPLAIPFQISTTGVSFRFNSFNAYMAPGAVQSAFNPKLGKNFTLLIREPTGVTASTTRQLWPGGWDPVSESGPNGVLAHQFGFRSNGDFILGSGTGYLAAPIPNSTDPFIEYFWNKSPNTVFTFEFHDSSYSPAVEYDSTGLSTGDFEFQPSQIAFGTNKLYTKADGSGVVFSGTIGATLDSVEKVINPLGTVAGFTSGGYTTTSVDDIEKFPFSISTGTSTNVGNLTIARDQLRGASSATDGFTAGGFSPALPGVLAIIDKFPFAISSGTASSHGTLSYARTDGAVNPSPSYGFHSGGFSPTSYNTRDIQKFPYSSAVIANSVGSLVAGIARQSDHESTAMAFIAGGLTNTYVSDIEKFPFSISSGNATDVGDLTETKGWNSGVSSETDGFSIGGYPQISTIEKFPFSISGTTATDVGDLTGTGREGTSAQSSTTDGFTAGGGFAAGVTIIQKFPFAISSGTAADTGGDLNQGIAFGAGHQD